MNLQFVYKIIAGAYDLLDVIYFHNSERSPRNAVLQSIGARDKVLDICTGTAATAIKIAKAKPGTKIIGIDLSKEMLRVAGKKLQSVGLRNMKVYCMDATDMKFKDKGFDKVLISLVLHESEEILAEQIIQEAKRVLKDEGEIIITEWEPSNKWWRKMVFAPIQCVEPKSYYSFIKKDLYAYFAQYDLEIIEEIHCDYTKVLRIKKM